MSTATIAACKKAGFPPIPEIQEGNPADLGFTTKGLINQTLWKLRDGSIMCESLTADRGLPFVEINVGGDLTDVMNIVNVRDLDETSDVWRAYNKWNWKYNR